MHVSPSPDECFALSHDGSGVLGMVNHGRNTNSSQFYITLKPASWMDKQYIILGWEMLPANSSQSIVLPNSWGLE